jgi:hypothetical protein
MAQFLDLKIAQGASYNGSPGTTLAANSFTMIGRFQLDMRKATSPIRVDLSATMGITLLTAPAITTITLRIVRGTSPSDFRVFESVHDLSFDQVGTQVLTITAGDFDPPADLVNYSLFATTNLSATRNGPESFAGLAASV